MTIKKRIIIATILVCGTYFLGSYLTEALDLPKWLRESCEFTAWFYIFFGAAYIMMMAAKSYFDRDDL